MGTHRKRVDDDRMSSARDASVADTITHYAQALRIQPDYADAKANLANPQATQEHEVPSRR